MYFKFLVLPLLLCLVGHSLTAGDVVVSRIDHQEMFVGSRITVYVSTLAYLDSARLFSPDLPDFGHIINDGHGSGRIIFDASVGNEGLYNITLEVTSSSFTNIQEFTLEVLPIPEGLALYYVDPENGSNDNDGSASAPWKTLGAVLNEAGQKIKPGSIVFLKTGYHGELNFWGQNDKMVYVVAQSFNTPTTKNITFSFTSHWSVSGLEISPQVNNELNNLPLAVIYGGCEFINIKNCYLYSFEDQSRWNTNQEWYAYSGNGIISTGNHCAFRNNLLKNTWFSTELKGDDQEFSYNIIDCFGADAMRGIADNLKFEYNQVKNAVVFDYDDPIRPQHDDAFQSWTFNLPRKNYIIRGNQIADISNPNLKLPSEITQGIVIFDGFAEDWVIENNLVVLHHAHGIAMYGAKNCKIINNTVVKNPFLRFNPTHLPWIRINPTKSTAGGVPSSANLVQNNFMHSYQTDGLEPATVKSNISGFVQNLVFSDYNHWDFSLNNSATNAYLGIYEDAPNIDNYNLKRDPNSIDIGCFQRNAKEHRDVNSLVDPLRFTAESGIDYIKVHIDNSIELPYFQAYKITCGDKIILSKENEAIIYNLESSTAYHISVSVLDIFNNESKNNEEEYVVTQTDNPGGINVRFLGAQSDDMEVNSNKNPMWGRSPYCRIGSVQSGVSQCVIIPFLFPPLLNNQKLIDADFITYVDTFLQVAQQHVDLYGMKGLLPLPFRDYYYEGALKEDQISIPIRSDYISTANVFQSYSMLDSVGKSTLIQFLNQQIDDGIAIGDQLIFRLNLNEKLSTQNSYYAINSSDSKLTYRTPVLKLVFKTIDSSIEERNISNLIQIFPNPCDGVELTLDLDEIEIKKEILLLIHENNGALVDTRKIFPSSNKVRIDLSNIDVHNGLYHITVSGDGFYGSQSFIIYKDH